MSQQSIRSFIKFGPWADEAERQALVELLRKSLRQEQLSAKDWQALPSLQAEIALQEALRSYAQAPQIQGILNEFPHLEEEMLVEGLKYFKKLITEKLPEIEAQKDREEERALAEFRAASEREVPQLWLDKTQHYIGQKYSKSEWDCGFYQKELRKLQEQKPKANPHSKALSEKKEAIKKLDADFEAAKKHLKTVIPERIAYESSEKKLQQSYLRAREEHLQALPKLQAQEQAYTSEEQMRLAQEYSQGVQILQKHILRTWQEKIDQRRTKEILAAIDALRKKILEELYKRIEEYKRLMELLGTFASGMPGRLWDLSKGNFRQTNFNVLLSYSKLLEQDQQLQELAELLGRFRSAEREYEEERYEAIRYKPQERFDYQQSEEFIGVRESDDLSNLIPSELVLLADSKTESLFFKKFAEKKLQTWEYRAKYLDSIPEAYSASRQKEKEKKKGPFILCIDTSGSMHGTPEHIAKVLAFAILRIALQEKRACYLISFSTQIETIELTDLAGSLDKLVQFLSMSFHGGTDAQPALRESLRKLQEQSFEKADVLMVSDFVMAGLAKDLVLQIEQQKEQGTAFHSLVIANSANTKSLDIFDHNWHYDSRDPDALLKLVKDIESMRKKQEPL